VASEFRTTRGIVSPAYSVFRLRSDNNAHYLGYRNPVLAEVMMVMRYANRFGRGIARAQALLAENGNPPAVFEYGTGYFKVTVFKHPER